MSILISLALVAIGIAVVYFRFRDNFSDMAAATDSKQSSGFWTIVAVIYAVVVAVLFLVFYRQGFARRW
jgi:uncharacterized membrane protein YidH (DUF202 family)